MCCEGEEARDNWEELKAWHHRHHQKKQKYIWECIALQAIQVRFGNTNSQKWPVFILYLWYKDCLTIWYLVAEMYSESRNCSNPVFDSKSGTGIYRIVFRIKKLYQSCIWIQIRWTKRILTKFPWVLCILYKSLVRRMYATKKSCS